MGCPITVVRSNAQFSSDQLLVVELVDGFADQATGAVQGLGLNLDALIHFQQLFARQLGEVFLGDALAVDRYAFCHDLLR